MLASSLGPLGLKGFRSNDPRARAVKTIEYKYEKDLFYAVRSAAAAVRQGVAQR